jgi:hypothetical protein
MSDLPIYPDSPILRSGVQFADLLPFKNVDSSAVWKKSDKYIAILEDAADVAKARTALVEPAKSGLLQAHGILFANRSGAGQLRSSSLAGPYRGQDCPAPEFIDRSLDNFFSWMTAESMGDIHPIEKSGLALTRIVDIWPFDFGNLTAAIILANAFLRQAGFAPFFVLPKHRAEFEKIVGQAITIETQPLVNAIHQTIKREMQALSYHK